MQGLHFSWNEAKAAVHRRKHGVDFNEAATVFLDDFARLVSDLEHSREEDRFILRKDAVARGMSLLPER